MKLSCAASSGSICSGSRAGLRGSKRSGSICEPIGASSTIRVDGTARAVNTLEVEIGSRGSAAGKLRAVAVPVADATGSCRTTPSVITTASTATTMVFNAVASTNTQGLSDEEGFDHGDGRVALSTGLVLRFGRPLLIAGIGRPAPAAAPAAAAECDREVS
jgi:hypothetical protein